LLTRASENGAEWGALVERLLNHETSFFRHPPSFDALRKHILPELRGVRARGGRLNLWSAGCSTGQEAYSLAMLAMDDEALQGEFTVWGGDISRQAIDIARRARYGPRAVATVPADYRQRFLRPVVTGSLTEYDIVEELRQRVRFMVTNLVGTDGFSANHDVIFCHNVLIYFSPAAVTQAVAHLASRLTLGGYLLLGPGEAPSERPPGLDPVNLSGVRAFQRRSSRPVEARE
jgi:type IV pilus assembly protein PilK